MKYVRASASWSYGQWMFRMFGRFFVLKAPWCSPLFSERYRLRGRVIPIVGGWRININRVGE